MGAGAGRRRRVENGYWSDNAVFRPTMKNLQPSPTALPARLSYEQARAILEEKNHAAKLELASRDDARPEMLYYLAGEQSSEIRREVARNALTPYHANRLLANDKEDEVRVELARKVARLLPDCDAGEVRETRERVIELLDLLAKDQATHVRQVIAEELKASPHAPKSVIQHLARDQESQVCAPILEYSPLLSDEDLREIIAYTKAHDALVAIARRQGLGEDVAQDIAASLDVPAVASLLANQSARIREETLNFIVDHAPDVIEWHEPLAKRPNLSLRLMRRIATFVASALVEVMVERNDLGAGDGKALLGRVKERLANESVNQDDIDSVTQTVRDFHARGLLNDAFLTEAIDNKQREVVIQALAILAHCDDATVRRVFASKNGRNVTALVWKAGLSMRTAYRVQTEVAFVPPQQILNARGGMDYPLSNDLMASLFERFLS
ncbi:MAG: DUF2336 domain-containing protein [Sphingomonadales bacterium]|nr:DUF2336 domain-containing protein [Sphingomonadales bacterium]